MALYQPDDVLKSRLGEDPSKLGAYIQRLNEAAVLEFNRYKGQGGSGALVVAVKPDGESRVWLVLGENKLPHGLEGGLKSRLEALQTLPVYKGPIAFAIVFDAWGGGVPVTTREHPLPIPQEWRDADLGPNPAVVPDAILDVIWP